MKAILLAVSIVWLAGCASMNQSVNQSPEPQVNQIQTVKKNDPSCKGYSRFNREFYYCIGSAGIVMVFKENGDVEGVFEVTAEELDPYNAEEIGDSIGKFGAKWLGGAEEISF